MNLSILALSSIRKKKGAAISLAILVALTAFLLNIGINLMIGAGSFFERKFKELNSPHNVILISANLYMPEYYDFFKHDSRVLGTELEEVVAMDVAVTQFGKGNTELAAIFCNTDLERSYQPFVPVGAVDVPSDEAIYLPLGLKVGTPGPGEPFVVQYKNKEFQFRVAGYFETTYMGTSNSGNVKYFLGKEAFERLYSEVGGSKMISVELRDASQSEALQEDYKRLTETDLEEDALSVFQFSYDIIRQLGLMAPSLYSVALLSFSGIIIAVVILVTWFRISSNIEDSWHNIGTLASIGYTPGQIIGSMLLEFTYLTLAGTALGVLLSVICTPFIEELITNAGSLIWRSRLQGLSALLCLALILGFVLLTSLCAAWRIHSVPPVLALHRGQQAHSFRKIWFPLQKAGPLTLKLIGKQIVMEWKQSIILLLVFVGISFTVVFSSILYTNMVTNQDALIRMLGVEVADVRAELTAHADADRLAEELSARPGVRSVSMADMELASVDGQETLFTISDNFNKTETLNVFQGSMPQYENEAVITGVLADLLGKEIGDMVEIKFHGVSTQYLITGLTQSTNMMGRGGMITLSGINRLDPFYRRNSVNINLEQGVDPQQFMKELKEQYGALSTPAAETHSASNGWELVSDYAKETMANLLMMYGVDSVQYALMVDGEIVVSGSSETFQIERLLDFRARLQAQTYALGALISQLSAAILTFSAVIIGLILFLLVRSSIQKQRKSLGIYRAMGYTSSLLSNVMVGSLLPAAAIGITLGMVLGWYNAGPLFSSVFYSMGISHALLYIDYPMILLLCGGILLYAYGVALLVARRIRNVTVYDLLVE